MAVMRKTGLVDRPVVRVMVKSVSSSDRNRPVRL
jgi:hypothetical protein